MTTPLPPMFYLCADPPEALPIGATFEAVFCPEATLNMGWRRVTFRVVWQPARGAMCRMYQQLAVLEISEDEAARVFRADAR